MGRLAADLRRVFGADQVFQDVASIDPGADFEDALRQGLQTCAAVLVVIGPDWLAKKDLRGRRRLGLADDWVRREVAESLNDKAVRVSPVLVGNAGMPGADELPSDIQALVRRQAYTVTTRHWAKDVDELVGLLKLAAGLVMVSAFTRFDGLFFTFGDGAWARRSATAGQHGRARCGRVVDVDCQNGTSSSHGGGSGWHISRSDRSK